jgi:hypothetical protein
MSAGFENRAMKNVPSATAFVGALFGLTWVVSIHLQSRAPGSSSPVNRDRRINEGTDPP